MWLQHLLSESACRFGAKTAIVAGRQRYSYSELDLKADRLAQALLGRGLKAGDCAVVFMDSCFEAVVSIFAVLKAGGVLVPIHPATGPDELASVLDDGHVTCLMTEARLASVAATAMADGSTIRLVVLAGGNAPPTSQTCLSFDNAVSRGGAGAALVAAEVESAPGMLVYETASFGRRSPVTVARAEIVAATEAALSSLAGGEEAVLLGVQPMSSARHLYSMLAAVKVGATMVLQRAAGAVEAPTAVALRNVAGVN
ncbi:MAG: class I adenylate-forming enzyme family protein [Bauldia sp.]